jgi:hypothetical protein
LTLVQVALDEVSTDLERVFGFEVVVVVVVATIRETQTGTPNKLCLLCDALHKASSIKVGQKD